MPRQLRPLFLAKGVYRRRRLRDAARLLPVLGIFLMALPLLWNTEDGAASARTLVYLFGIWALLIALAAYLAPGLARPENDEVTGPEAGKPLTSKGKGADDAV